MDAKKVMMRMNEMWMKLMGEHYEYIVSTMIEECSVEEDKERLKEVMEQKKEEIMNMSGNCVMEKETKKKKPKTEKKVKVENVNNGIYRDKTRKELKDMCMERGLTVKRSNQDMIDQLLEKDQLNPTTPATEEPTTPTTEDEPAEEEPTTEDEPAEDEPAEEEPAEDQDFTKLTSKELRQLCNTYGISKETADRRSRTSMIDALNQKNTEEAESEIEEEDYI